MSKLFNRLDFKAGLFAFICVAFIMLIEGFFAYQEMEREKFADFTENSQSMTETMANAMEFALWDFDIDVIKEMMLGMGENQTIISTSVTHANGDLVSEINHKQLPAIEENYLVLSEIIRSPSEENIGTFKAVFSLDALKGQMKSYLLFTIFRAFVVSSLVYLVIALTLEWVIKPIRSLKESVKNYNGSEKLEIIQGLERDDEIGSLARGFKQIADQIHYNVIDLEERVEQRTFDLVEAVEKAAAANKAKSSFLANMSHEIRTPMNGVLGMAQVLQGTKLNEKQRTFVNTIYDSGSALLTIINDILDYSKIEAGKVALDPAPFNMGDAVEDVATLLGATARDKDLELMVRIQPDLPKTFMGDVGRIRQIITNLVGNAVKFTNEGSVVIDVSGQVENDNADLKIAIKDTGIGLAPDKLDVIFDEFNQAENSTTRKFGGTGLGLSITKSLIEAMGGNISVESKLGKGSDFIVSIRLQSVEDNEEKNSPEYFFNQEIALVVDDNKVNRDIMNEVLMSWNLKPIFADSAKQALLSLKQAEQKGMTVSIILTDYNMPEYDGVDLVRAISKMPNYAKTPIIALSSSSGEDVAKAFKKYGVAEIFVKPVRTPLLNSAVHRLLLDNNINSLGQIAASFADEKAEPQDSPVKSSEPEHKRRILVTDDNEINREVLGHMIDDVVFEVDFAEDGQVAFELAKSNRYEMIFMDISMPVMDGIASMKAIRAFEVANGIASTPIIATTAHAMSGDKERMLGEGMSDYLSKPVAQVRLDEALKKWEHKKENSTQSIAV